MRAKTNETNAQTKTVIAVVDNHDDQTVFHHAPKTGRRQYADDIVPIWRIGNRVRMRIHLAGGFYTAKKQDHNGNKDQDCGNRKDEILKKPWNSSSHPARGGNDFLHD